VSLPDNTLSEITVEGVLLTPDIDGRSPNKLVDYELGGVALNDASQGIDVKIWRATYSGGSVKFSPSPFVSETSVITVAGITELSIAFDQNMRPTVAYRAGGECRLYWYDSLIESPTTTVFNPTALSPFLTMDDKRYSADERNDILFFYIQDGVLCYRQQRDRFGVERELTTVPGGYYIKKCGMNNGLRLQLELESE